MTAPTRERGERYAGETPSGGSPTAEGPLRDSPSRDAWTSGIVGLCLTVYGLLLAAALLREQHCFWVDACGWPRLLRTLVGIGFWPATVSTGLLLAALTGLRERPRVLRWPIGGWLGRLRRPRSALRRHRPVAWLWLMLAIVLWCAVADNAYNVVVGLPLHYSAPVRCCPL